MQAKYKCLFLMCLVLILVHGSLFADDPLPTPLDTQQLFLPELNITELHPPTIDFDNYAIAIFRDGEWHEKPFPKPFAPSGACGSTGIAFENNQLYIGYSNCGSAHFNLPEPQTAENVYYYDYATDEFHPSPDVCNGYAQGNMWVGYPEDLYEIAKIERLCYTATGELSPFVPVGFQLPYAIFQMERGSPFSPDGKWFVTLKTPENMPDINDVVAVNLTMNEVVPLGNIENPLITCEDYDGLFPGEVSLDFAENRLRLWIYNEDCGNHRLQVYEGDLRQPNSLKRILDLSRWMRLAQGSKVTLKWNQGRLLYALVSRYDAIYASVWDFNELRFIPLIRILNATSRPSDLSYLKFDWYDTDTILVTAGEPLVQWLIPIE